MEGEKKRRRKWKGAAGGKETVGMEGAGREEGRHAEMIEQEKKRDREKERKREREKKKQKKQKKPKKQNEKKTKCKKYGNEGKTK